MSTYGEVKIGDVITRQMSVRMRVTEISGTRWSDKPGMRHFVGEVVDVDDRSEWDSGDLVPVTIHEEEPRGAGEIVNPSAVGDGLTESERDSIREAGRPGQ